MQHLNNFTSQGKCSFYPQPISHAMHAVNTQEKLINCNRQIMLVLGDTDEIGLGDVRWWKDA